jgi:hypothetical protein
VLEVLGVVDHYTALNTPAVTAQPETVDAKEVAERRLRMAMAAEAKAERAQRDKIKKGFFGCMGVLVLLFLILMLFF